MQQPPNYYGNSYPSNSSFPSNSKPGYSGSGPYMNSGDYPMPVRETKDNTVPNPPSNQNTIDNDESTKVYPFEGMEEREITIYATFPDSVKWHDKVFKGYLLSRSNDALIIFDKETKTYVTIVSVYVNYVETKNRDILFDNIN